MAVLGEFSYKKQIKSLLRQSDEVLKKNIISLCALNEIKIKTESGTLHLGRGGGTSLSNHTGIRTSFGWVLTQEFWERDVLFEEDFLDGGVTFDRISENAHV